jgi:hypothetical protein
MTGLFYNLLPNRTCAFRGEVSQRKIKERQNDSCNMPGPQKDGRMLQLIKINPGTKNLNNFRLSVLDAVHFLAVSWDLISAAVISNCFRKSGF